MKISTISESEVKQIAALHIKALPETISSKIGIFYLESIYRAIVRNPENNVAFVAKEKEKILGVIVATSNLKLFGEQFKKELSFKSYAIIVFLMATFKIPPYQVFKRYFFEKKLIQSYKKSYVSITVLFVNRKERGKGIGSSLVKKVLKFYKDNVTNIYVDTLLANKKAIGFYRSLGFKPQKEIEDSILLKK